MQGGCTETDDPMAASWQVSSATGRTFAIALLPNRLPTSPALGMRSNTDAPSRATADHPPACPTTCPKGVPFRAYLRIARRYLRTSRPRARILLNILQSRTRRELNSLRLSARSVSLLTAAVAVDARLLAEVAKLGEMGARLEAFFGCMY